jgi:hypothetical protein
VVVMPFADPLFVSLRGSPTGYLERMEKTIVLPAPDLVAALGNVGRTLRPLREIVDEAGPLSSFSDYQEEGNYCISTLYLTGQEHWKALTNRLEKIRLSGNVASRALQYKNRKSWGRLWPDSIGPWLAAVIDTPGLAVCVAYSNRFLADSEHTLLRKSAAAQFANEGRDINAKVAIAALKKLLPFFVIAPLLQQMTLGWASDHDSMLEGGIGEELFETLMSYLDHAGANVSLLHPVYRQSDQLSDEIELALTLPDLVCGVLGKILPSPFTPTSTDLVSLDDETRYLLRAISQMGRVETIIEKRRVSIAPSAIVLG